MALNYTALQGRLTKDPEVKMTQQSGTPVCQITIAVNRDYKNQEGNTEADFITCVAWKNTAEFIGKYFRKGQEIIIEGQLQVRSYTDKDGAKRYVTEVKVDRARFCGAKKDNETESEYKPSYADTAPKFEEISNDDDLPF